MTDDVGPLRLALAKFVYIVHVGVTFLFRGAGFYLGQKLGGFGLFFIPTMLIHWKTADVCILTTIEMKLRGHPKAGTREQGIHSENGSARRLAYE